MHLLFVPLLLFAMDTSWKAVITSMYCGKRIELKQLEGVVGTIEGYDVAWCHQYLLPDALFNTNMKAASHQTKFLFFYLHNSINC